MLLHCLILLPLVLGSPVVQSHHADAEVLTYEGYQAFQVNIKGKTEEILAALSAVSYDRWTSLVDKHIDIALAPEEISKFKGLGLDWTEKIKDVGEIIKKEKREQWRSPKGPDDLPHDSWFNSYHDYDDHIKFWQELQSAFPRNSEWFSSGTSLQGRDIFGLKLEGRSSPQPKKAVIFHGQVHAREWIAGMTVEFITYQMIAEYKRGNRDVQRVLDEYDFYIVPFVNPDGFVFTTTTQRLHRKNMRPAPAGVNATCIGVDVNRNWPNEWDTNPGGSSPDPCSQTYRGQAPGSEPETESLIAHISSVARAQEIKLFIDWHSFGNLILSPWGYTCDVFPQNNDNLTMLARETGDVIQSVYGTVFRTGSTCQTLYALNGGSSDYVYDRQGAEYSYLFELRGAGNGTNGFLLPAEQIRPTGEENWKGILYMLQNM